ncbi:MAG TPA: DNA alkylation repair protein [Methanocorpusculum sp.]|nr:DNA alkylation repair protein [Methanocorpusculum sp.]
MRQMEKSKREIIREELESLAEEKYRKFSSGLLPGSDNLLGVRIPKLREIAKREAKADWRAYLKDASDGSFEEIMLQGLVISYAKAAPEEICKALDIFVPKVDNWSVCDSTAMTIQSVKKHPDIFFSYAKKCIAEGTEFSVRFGIVLLLAHFITDEYYKKVLALLNRREFPGYYAKTAAAWAVSVLYVKYPDETEEWMKDCLLDDETINKAVQKIKESYRVTPDAKQRAELLKR